MECNNANYQNKWETRSSIRTTPRKDIDFSKGGFFFPPGKQVLLLLPEIINMGEPVKTTILLHSFYKYLNDIVNLEVKLITLACNNLIYDDLIVKYTESTKINAYTIIIDEYYHVYIARDMMSQLDKQFPHFKKLAFPDSDAYTSVLSIKNSLEPKYRSIFDIIAVCIFETTLVKELVEFFNDKEVHPSIRYYVNDHMNDEAKHHGFFQNLLEYTWANLPDDYKQCIGSKLADFVKLYLNVESEKYYNQLILESLLPNEAHAKELINNMYNNFQITHEIPIVKNVLNVFKRTHVMDCQFVKDNFVASGLYI